MTISSIFQPRPENPDVGLWGIPTSSVNWCETDYTISFYVAEFFNSCSSMCMVSFGLLGQWSLKYLSKNVNRTPRPRKPEEEIYDPLLSNPRLLGIHRVWLTWFALQIVGWGSVAFHGSLQWWSQAFDEVPMVWTAILHLSTCIVGRFDPFPLASAQTWAAKGGLASYFIPKLRRTSNGEPYTQIISPTFLVHAVACALLVTIFRGPSQFLVFHVLFGSVEIAGFFFTYQMSVEASDPSHPRGVGYIKDSVSESTFKYLSQRHRQDVLKLHKRGLWLYLLAIAIWSTDLNFCDYVSNVPFIYPDLSSLVAGNGLKWIETTFNPQGHAWWHLMVSMGFYHLGVLATYDRILAGYRTFWDGVEKGDVECVELLAENKIKGRKVAKKGDVPVVEWIGGWIPVVAMWREH